MAHKYLFPDHPGLMQPLMPSDTEDIAERCYTLAIESAKLSSALPPATAQAVGALVRGMNCYYSNLIEGHDTRPAEIDRAMRGDYSGVPKKRALQLEARAHIETEESVIEALEPTSHFPLTQQFLGNIHRRFYENLPDEMHIVRGPNGIEDRVIPGQFRTRDVTVGHHYPVAATALPAFMATYNEFYSTMWSQKKLPYQKVAIIAASHHRLLWIHPFLDGNGRVSRLAAIAGLKAAGIEGIGLWSPARGFARSVDQYKTLLEAADAQRQGMMDGRGNLSAQALKDFVMYFVESCIDQVRFMDKMFDLGGLENRVKYYIGLLSTEHRLPMEAADIIIESIRAGGIMREKAQILAGKSERTTRDLMAQLSQLGLVKQSGQRMPYLPAFPTHAVGAYFPNLFPAGAPEDMPTRSDVRKPMRP